MCAPLGFPYYPLLVLSSAAENVSNFLPPCHGVFPSSGMHDNTPVTAVILNRSLLLELLKGP